MKLARLLLVALLSLPVLPAAAAADDDAALGHMLSLVQVVVRLAGQNDPAAMEQLLAGGNAQANQAAAGLFSEITADMPAAQRQQMASIAGEVLGLARRDLSRPPAERISTDQSLQARKDLNAMGLRYYDEEQFRAAVKRGDKLAVDLFVAGKGIDPAVVARSLPAAR
jgi:hypothetical protein